MRTFLRLILLTLILLLAIPAFSQSTPAPAPTTSTSSPLFHVEAGVSATFINGSQNTTATIVDAWLPLKNYGTKGPALAIMYRQFIMPAYNGSSYQGGVEERWHASQFTKSTAWGSINPQNLTFGVNETLGTWRNAPQASSNSPGAASFAYAVTAFAEYKLPTSIVGQVPASLRYEGGVFHANKVGTFGLGSVNDPQNVLGVKFTF